MVLTTSDADATTGRSADPCPVCGNHHLALEQPPHIPVAGAQPYTELYRMGDLPMPVGVRCRTCGTAWPTIAALRAGEPGSAEEVEPVEGLDDVAAPAQRRPGSPLVDASMVLVAIIGGVALLIAGFLVPAMIVVMATVLLLGVAARRRRGS